MQQCLHVILHIQERIQDFEMGGGGWIFSTSIISINHLPGIRAWYQVISSVNGAGRDVLMLSDIIIQPSTEQDCDI